MGFCTPAQHEQFLRDAPEFERMLTESGIHLIKLWLDISKAVQERRLDERRSNPLKTLKVSPLDAVAQEKWDAYSDARDEMLRRTHTGYAPWTIVRADHKKKARPQIIRLILDRLAPKAIAERAGTPDPDIVFTFELAALEDGRLAR
jgi:polyphosphate kinase 2 (PPK2 family)